MSANNSQSDSNKTPELISSWGVNDQRFNLELGNHSPCQPNNFGVSLVFPMSNSKLICPGSSILLPYELSEYTFGLQSKNKFERASSDKKRFLESLFTPNHKTRPEILNSMDDCKDPISSFDEITCHLGKRSTYSLQCQQISGRTKKESSDETVSFLAKKKEIKVKEVYRETLQKCEAFCNCPDCLFGRPQKFIKNNKKETSTKSAKQSKGKKVQEINKTNLEETKVQYSFPMSLKFDQNTSDNQVTNTLNNQIPEEDDDPLICRSDFSCKTARPVKIPEPKLNALPKIIRLKL